MKKFTFPVLTILFIFLLGFSSFAADYSSAWYEENGNWHVKGPDGEMLKNCWFCDDAVFANQKNIWYLLDANGNMVANPLVRDGSGNYYSLETEHNGHYGSLRYQDGYYNDVPMSFSKQHDGTFGALISDSAIELLKDEFGVRDISAIDSNNCYYSSNWLGTSGTSVASSNTAAGPSGAGEVISDDAFRKIIYRDRTTIVASDSGNTRVFTVKNYKKQFFKYWSDVQGNLYYPGELYIFEGNIQNMEMYAHFEE